MNKRFISIAITFFLMMSICLSAYAEDSLKEDILQTVNSINNISDKSFLSDENYMTPGNSVCDWMAIALAMSGEPGDYDKYLKRLEEYVTNQYEKTDCLDSTRATEYHRIALCVLALGGNPESFGKDKSGNKVNLIADGTYEFAGGNPGSQGVNGLAYALIALDSKAYEVPKEYELTREILISHIIAMQNEDGGFSLMEDSGSNIDGTAMCLQAMAPYTNREEVAAAVDKALEYLAGVISSEELGSSEAISQTIIALTCLGINPECNERFSALLDMLNSFRMDNGMYKHSLEDSAHNLMSTEQALLALESVDILKNEGRSIFDFTDYELNNSGDFGNVWIGTAIIVILIIVVTAIGKLKKQKKAER